MFGGIFLYSRLSLKLDQEQGEHKGKKRERLNDPERDEAFAHDRRLFCRGLNTGSGAHALVNRRKQKRTSDRGADADRRHGSKCAISDRIPHEEHDDKAVDRLGSRHRRHPDERAVVFFDATHDSVRCHPANTAAY